MSKLMRVVDNWRDIVKYSWSVRLMALSAILSGVGTSLTIAQPYLGVSPLTLAGIIGAITTVSSLIGIYARMVKQETIN